MCEAEVTDWFIGGRESFLPFFSSSLFFLPPVKIPLYGKRWTLFFWRMEEVVVVELISRREVVRSWRRSKRRLGADRKESGMNGGRCDSN